jgi:3-oxoadipate enol-lactonase
MPLIEVNGVRLNVAVEGEGSPLVLLHGLGSSIASLSAEIAQFRPRFQIIAIDARGHGGSDRPVTYTIHDHIADVLGVMDALGISACALLGRSMGSYIAQGVASTAPERVGKLVLVVPRAHASESSIARLRRHHAAELLGRSAAEQERILLGYMLAPSTPRRKVALLAALAENPATPLSEAGEAAAMAATAKFDFRAALPRITARTLVISGRHDWLNPPEEGALIAAQVPDARHVVLEHSGHLPAVEEKEAYLSLLADFLIG